jgi:hypothetical protein
MINDYDNTVRTRGTRGPEKNSKIEIPEKIAEKKSY